jgi:hypothetical protein
MYVSCEIGVLRLKLVKSKLDYDTTLVICNEISRFCRYLRTFDYSEGLCLQEVLSNFVYLVSSV